VPGTRRRDPYRLRPPGDASALTAREREVAALITQGASNREIAAELQLSVRTVETYVSHILEKLGVSRRAALAAQLSNQKVPPVVS
jgi:non-specific serine/threonine protein kinase